MCTSFDTAGQELFDDACAALEASADDVAVMEQALDVICVLLRREEDGPLRDRALSTLTHCLDGLDRRGPLPPEIRTRTLRGAARDTIRQVIAERPANSRSAPVHPPCRRATDSSPA